MKKILYIMIIFISVVDSYSETTGASFLNIGIGARAIGMGSAWTAISDDKQVGSGLNY